MAVTAKEAPILVAEFPGKSELWDAVRELEESRIGRDFIGVLIGEDGHEPNGGGTLHLVSVLAPSRLHEEIRSAFDRCGAEAVGNRTEMAARHGVVPHPGALEDHDMKLPMGSEFPRPKDRRKAQG